MINTKEERSLIKLWKKLVHENNLIIVIPAIFIILMITGFMIFGFQEPITKDVESNDTLLTEQILRERSIIETYNEGDYSESDPYFKIDPYGIAPLTALLMFETEERIQYRLVVEGKTPEASLSYITNPATFHFIPVYGLYLGGNDIKLYPYDANNPNAIVTPVYENDFVLVDGINQGRIAEVVSIETNATYFGSDWMFVTPAGDSLPAAYDVNGDVRWYSSVPLAFAPEILHNGRLLIGTDRIMSDPYYTTGMYEMDFLGKIYNEYYLPGGYHHDAYELENGNLIVLSSDFDGTVEDIVVEIDRTTGDVIKSWDIADYINTFDGMAEMWTTDDWFHNNSIDYDQETDSIILSGRHQDVVVSIGYTSNELNWILGDPDNWAQETVDEYFFTPTGTSFEWFYAQHSALALSNNRIFLFDNGNNKSKDSSTYVPANESYSRGVIYSLDTDTMEIAQDYQFGKELGSDFYSPYISNVEYYREGHYMIHSGGISSSETEGPLNIPAPLYQGEDEVTMRSITYEVEDGEVKYRLELDGNFYRALRVEPYNERTRFSIGEPKVLGTQEVSPQFEGELERRITIFRTVPIKHELNIIKHSDRLEVEGVFDRYDKIYLVLRNETEELIYHIPTSRTAYTAMCTAIFQGDERVLTYYINEQNVAGSYSIYLSVNGHTYNTYLAVEFDD